MELRFLRCHPETAVWDLSEPTLYPFPSATASNPIVHLAWAPTHHAELAVVDLSGRVAILTFSTSLNRPLPTRKWDADQVDSLESVVGSYWLGLIPQNKQVSEHGHGSLSKGLGRLTSVAVPHTLWACGEA